MRRLLRGLLAVAVLAVLTVLLAPAAGAHAVVVGSNPADGSRLKASPTAVTIRFDEQVGLQPGYLRVVDSAGWRVDNGQVTHPAGLGSSISVPLKSGLGDGTYLASFRVVSADGHPVAGSIRYVVGNGPLGGGAAGSGSAPVAKVVATGLAVSHWLSLAGVAVAGGSWLVLSLWPHGRRRRTIRRLIWSGWGVAALGAVIEYLLQGPYAAGSSLGTLWHADLLDATLHANEGQLLSLRLMLLGIFGVVLTAVFSDDRLSDAQVSDSSSSDAQVDDAQVSDGAQGHSDSRQGLSWGPESAAVVGLGIVLTFAAAGHSQSLNPRWLSILADGLHLSAMIVWLGGVAVLLVAAFGRASELTVGDEPKPDTVQLAARLPIFSRIAMGCIATLAVTGTILAWRGVGTVDAIATTWYGKLVLIKIVLFGGVVFLGNLARRAVLSRSAGVPLLPRLRRTLLTEVLVGALVLAATGVLVSQPPGKVALAAERSKPRQTSVRVTAQSQALVEVDPGVHGNVRIEVQLSGGLHPSAISATASLPAQKLGPIPVALQAAGPQSYTASGVLLPAAGTWEITLSVRTSEFDSTVAVAKVKVA